MFVQIATANIEVNGLKMYQGSNTESSWSPCLLVGGICVCVGRWQGGGLEFKNRRKSLLPVNPI